MDKFEVYLLDRINHLKSEIDNNANDDCLIFSNADCIDELLDVFFTYRNKYKIWGSSWYDEN